MIKFQLNLLVLFSILFLFSSCASRTAGWMKSDDKISLSKEEMQKLKSSALVHWSKRHEKEELELAIADFEKLSKATTENYDYLVYLTRGYYFLADAHLTDMNMKKKYWELGTSYGEKAMATNQAFASAMKKDEKVEDHLDKLGKGEVAAMYWTAANLGKWAKNSGIATTLKYKNRIRTLIGTVEKLDPSYFHAAVYRYWGGYYAVAPGFAGGSMPKSKESFEKAIKLAPEYLGTKVLYAEYYMIKKEDKESFKKLLNEVINSNVKNQELFSENFIEKLKAKQLLADIDKLF